jgi:hypothetical protein
MRSLLDTVRDDLGLARRSLDEARPTWIALMLACVGVTAAATWVGQRIGGYPGYLFGEFRLEGLHAGTMTAVTAFFLGAAGMSLFGVAWLFARREDARRLVLPWAIAAAGLFILGADDLLFAHEILARRLADRGIPRAIGENLALAAYILGTLLVLPRLLETVRRHWRSMFPLVCGLAMFALSVITEIIVPAEPTGAAAVVGGIVDRSGKVLGCVMMFAFAQTLLIAVAKEPPSPTR